MILPADTAAGKVARAQAVAWANLVQAGTCVSVRPEVVRCDDAQWMQSWEHALLALISASQLEAEHDPVGYLRQHADRVLLVTDDPLLPYPRGCVIPPDCWAMPQPSPASDVDRIEW